MAMIAFSTQLDSAERDCTHLFESCKQSSDAASAKVQWWECQPIDQHHHNVLPAKRRCVLSDSLDL